MQRNYTGFGDRNSKDYLTYLIYPKDKSQTTVYNTNGKGETKIEVQQSAKNIVIELKGEKRPHIVLVSSTKQPRTILLDNVQLFEGKQWIVDTEHHKIKITTKTYSTGKYEILF